MDSGTGWTLKIPPLKLIDLIQESQCDVVQLVPIIRLVMLLEQYYELQ